MQNLAEKPISDRFQHLLAVMSSESFLKMEGLNNEIPFFIFPYDPREHNEITSMCKQLINRLANEGVTVLEVNLYDLSIELLKDRGIWEQILEVEPEFTKAELKEDLQGALNPEHHIIPAIDEKMTNAHFDILFLTGVGEVFPYIRSHTILNNLQSTAKNCPTVLWFPGEYTFTVEGGSSLDLFGRLHDDKYYRAFNILDYQLS
jgi:hypothetical protein